MKEASAADLQQVRDFLYARTGLVYGDAKRYFVARRIAQRMGAAGYSDFGAYYERVRVDAAEADALVNAFTINETYFYREKHQLKTLSASLLPILTAAKAPGDKVRIWSIPCSTGEEAYSLAVWLLETWPLVDAYNVEIVGSDIDTQALAAAKDGFFGARALGRMPDELKARYFEPAGPERWRLIQDLRESVHFSRANLVDLASVAAQGRFDAILCRNLLIYFDEQSRNRALDNLYRALAPGGFLLLGHTESLAKVDERFIPTRYKEGVVYRKPVDVA